MFLGSTNVVPDPDPIDYLARYGQLLPTAYYLYAKETAWSSHLVLNSFRYGYLSRPAQSEDYQRPSHSPVTVLGIVRASNHNACFYESAHSVLYTIEELRQTW